MPVTVGAEAFHAASPDRRSARGYRRVAYPHIRPGILEVPASVRLRPIACRLGPPRRVGYVEGTGDRVPEALTLLGLRPVYLTPDSLLTGNLDAFDVILLGVRAYKVRPDLARARDRLFDWVARGGTLLVQYNKLEFNAGAPESPFAPYPGASVGHHRVTVEESPVEVLDPAHPILTRPNRLGAADWAGWVQERGLYFLDTTDPRYHDLVRLEDPFPYNAGPRSGALVSAAYGRGTWVYIGLGLFRQLPAAVPGAFRLLANLIALGRPAPASVGSGSGR